MPLLLWNFSSQIIISMSMKINWAMSITVENKLLPTLYLLSREYEIRFPWKSPCVCVLSHFSHVRSFVTLWTVFHQTALSMGFSRQKYWSGLPCPPPGDLLTQESNPCLCLPALAGALFTTSTTWETQKGPYLNSNLALINQRTVKSYVEILNSWTHREIMA